MSVSIVGSSSVGTTVAACFPDPGYHVNNIDIDQSMAMLRSCITNKYEEASLTSWTRTSTPSNLAMTDF